MKTHRGWAVGIVLAGMLLMLQAPLSILAQDAPSQNQQNQIQQDQVQQDQAPPDQAQPTQDQAAPQDQEPPPQDQAQPAQDQAPPPQDQGQPAQAAPPSPAQDPPGRVARLSYSTGSVSFQPGGEGDWVEAVKNRPLTTGDNLWADKDSRAEVQTGSTSIRLDSETSVTILDLEDRTTQLKLSQGSIIVRVRHLDDEDHFEIDAPNLAFQIQREGEYRLDVSVDGNETDATVWHGRGEVTGGGSSYVVVAGQRARFTGSDQLDHEIDQMPNSDDFDNFAFQRDGREDHAESSNYISPEMTGASDLDEYGHWRYVADYGPVWAPAAVAPGWAPYRFGHWVWVAPWGWSWVEDEPWGFAPFHYGRWAFVESSWCWVPGPVFARPVYAPALVAFVGGGGFGFGVGFGAGVAWFPLAPREVFVPWYRTSPGYVNNVNITNTRVSVTQVTNVYNTTIVNRNSTAVTRTSYANQHVNNAVTAVSHDTFVNARPVAASMVKVDQRQMENAPVVHNVAAQPSRSSVMGTGRPATVKPPAAVTNRQVVAVRQPPAPRSSFEQRRSAAPNVRTETPGQPQPASRSGNESPRSGQPAARSNEPAGPQGNRPTANVPRPGAPPAQTSRPGESPAQAQRSIPHPPGVQGGHPLVRPAPPVRENAQHQQNEQSKFNAWQQQRSTSRPSPSRGAPSRSQPSGREEKPHK